jgi:hypothetical protein
VFGGAQTYERLTQRNFESDGFDGQLMSYLNHDGNNLLTLGRIARQHKEQITKIQCVGVPSVEEFVEVMQELIKAFPVREWTGGVSGSRRGS